MSSDIRLEKDQVVVEGNLAMKDGERNYVSLGPKGNLLLGGHGHDGDIMLFPNDAEDQKSKHGSVHLDADNGNLHLGGNGRDGDIALYPSSARITDDATEAASILLDADAGDIKVRAMGSLVKKMQELEDRIRELERAS